MSEDSISARQLATALALLVLTTAFWGGNAVVGRSANEVIPAFTLSFYRWVFAALILFPFGLPRALRQWPLYARQWKRLIPLGILSVTLYNTLQYWALNWTTAINVGVVSAAMPMAVFTLTWALGYERANRMQLLGMVLATLGVIVVVLRGDPGTLLSLDVNRGDGIMLLSVLSWAAYSAFLRTMPLQFDPLGLLTVLVVIGLAGIAPFYAWDLWQGLHFEINTRTSLTIAYVSIGPSVLAYMFWIKAVRLGGANLAGLSFTLVAVFASLFAIAFLDESLHGYHVAGIAMIFLGILLATVIGRRVHAGGAARAGPPEQ